MLKSNIIVLYRRLHLWEFAACCRRIMETQWQILIPLEIFENICIHLKINFSWHDKGVYILPQLHPSLYRCPPANNISPNFNFFHLNDCMDWCNTLRLRCWQEEQLMKRKSLMQSNGFFFFPILTPCPSHGWDELFKYLQVYRRALCQEKYLFYVSLSHHIIRFLTCTSHGWKCSGSPG